MEAGFGFWSLVFWLLLYWYVWLWVLLFGCCFGGLVNSMEGWLWLLVFGIFAFGLGFGYLVFVIGSLALAVVVWLLFWRAG